MLVFRLKKMFECVCVLNFLLDILSRNLPSVRVCIYYIYISVKHTLRTFHLSFTSPITAITLRLLLAVAKTMWPPIAFGCAGFASQVANRSTTVPVPMPACASTVACRVDGRFVAGSSPRAVQPPSRQPAPCHCAASTSNHTLQVLPGCFHPHPLATSFPSPWLFFSPSSKHLCQAVKKI